MSPLSRMAVAGAVLTAMSCAATPPPSPGPRIAEAEEALDRALQLEAGEFASLEVQMAADKLEQARSLVETDTDPNFERARRLAEEARLDARLAEVKAEAARAQELRDQLARAVDVLRESERPMP